MISSLQNHFCGVFRFFYFCISWVSHLYLIYLQITLKGPLKDEGVMKYFSARYLVIRVRYSWCGCIQGMYTDMHACERNNIILSVCLPIPTGCLCSVHHAFYGFILPDGFSKPPLCVRNSIFITNPRSLSS